MALKLVNKNINNWLQVRKSIVKNYYVGKRRGIILLWWYFFPPKFSPETIEAYRGFGQVEKCATMVANQFYEDQTPEIRFITGNPKLMKWNPFNAAKFFIQLSHITMIAIFQEWLNAPNNYPGPEGGPHDGPPAMIKPQIIIKLMVNNPAFSDDKDKVKKLADLLTHPKLDNIFASIMTKWAPNEIAKFFEMTTVPMIPGLTKHLDAKAAANYMAVLKASDGKRFGQLLDTMPGDYKGELLKELGMKDGFAQTKKKEETEMKTNDARLTIQNTIGDILTVFKDRLTQQAKATEAAKSQPPSEAPKQLGG